MVELVLGKDGFVGEVFVGLVELSVVEQAGVGAGAGPGPLPEFTTLDVAAPAATPDVRGLALW